MSGAVFPARGKSKKRIHCCVYGCQSSFQKNADLVFHCFPKANARFVYITNIFDKKEKIDQLRAWKNALRIEGQVTPTMKVCSLHFRIDDYILPNAASQKRRLKITAIPSCNLPRSSVGRNTRSQNEETPRERRSQNRDRQKKELEEVELEGDIGNETCEEICQEEECHLSIDNPRICESNSRSEKSLVEDIGIQVKSDFFTPSFLAFITNDTQLSTATGIETMKTLDTIVEIASIASSNDPKDPRVRMSLREKIVMTYVKLKQNASYSFLAILFQCYTAKHCQRIFYETLTLLSQCLGIAINWPTKTEILKNLPKCFQDFENVRVVLDCTEIFIQQPKKLCCQILTYSRYKSSNTCKIMTGVTPAGNISFISEPYGGRASDDSIFRQSHIIDLLEPGDGVMVDRGFQNIDELCARNNCKCIRPPFLKDKKQFSKSEALLTAKIAKARVHIERSNQRIKMFKIVGDRMPANLIPRLRDIFTVICATVNLSSPIIKDDKFMDT